MWSFIARLFDTSGFPPRWQCGEAWQQEAGVGYLHIASDLATFAAYYAVPCVVVYFVARHHNVKFPRIFYVFLGLIFFSCGTVHLIEAGIFWWPVYRFSALAKLLTASVSCVGVVVLARILPKALELKSGEEYQRQVSGRQEAEASLEFERSLLHTLMDQLPDAIYFKDRSGRFLRVSKALADKLNLADPADAKGMTDTDFLDGEQASQARRDEREIMETGESKIGIVEKQTWPDGSETWVSTTKAPLWDKRGGVIGTFGVSRDITEIKETEKSLRASEQRFELCVRGSNDGIWDWNVKTNEVYYAPRFKELLGLESHEMDNVLEAWRSRLHPDDLEPTFDAVDAHLQRQVPYDVECRLRTKSNTFKWFRNRGQALWDDTGKATRMAGSITEITERKLAEEKLKTVASKLALPGEATSKTPAPVHLSRFSLRDMISCGSDIRRMSTENDSDEQFAERIVQYLRTRLVDDTGQPGLALVRLFRSREYRELDHELQAFAGTLAPDQLAPDTKCLTLLSTAGDEPDWNDRTKSMGHRAIPLPNVEAVEELPMIAQLIRQLGFSVGGILRGEGDVLVSNVGTGVFHVAEAQGSPFIPAQSEFVLPHGIRSVVGFGDVLPSGQLFAVICFSKVAISPQTALLFSHLSLSTRLALLAYEKDTSRVESQIVTVDRLLGNYEKVVCSQEEKLDNTMKDLTKARDAAEAASRAKSDFLANMSHEIRTPMNGVIGMTELLSSTELSKEQHDYLGMVKHSADSLLHLLNDILDFSKIEAGKLELESTTFNVRETIGRTAQTLGVRAAEKGLELNCRIDPKLPDNLVGDPGRLRQIVVNLAGNAVKFTAQGEVNIDVAEESRTEDQVCLHISVKDTGIGIPVEKQKVIFEAFSQADESTTREYGGTGLGLAICSQLIDIMQGRIRVESEVGKGTTFHVSLALKIADTPDADDANELGELEGMRILVVDDNATNRRVLEEILTSWKLNPVSAEDGEAALRELNRAARTEPYQMVLLDCMMPGLDGFAVAERVRQNPDLQGATMIMISSAARPGDADRCRDFGIARYMTKPVVQSELLDVLLSVTGGPQTSRQAVMPKGELEFELPVLKVLLVEDGVVNQKVALGFLELFGHDVTIANNGREAVEAHARAEFDVVLMDVQMPEMDGVQATAIIRQNEQRSGRRTPIIAMTAAAMKGDRERCLKAGMDAYIAKPIAGQELFEALRRFAPVVPPDQETSPPPPADEARSDIDTRTGATTSADQSLFDPVAAESRIPGGRQAVKEMAQLLVDECPKLLGEIEDAVLQQDAERVGRGAHTLKGSADVFAARRVVECARQLEKQGRLGDLSDAKRLFSDLSAEVDRLIKVLHNWVQSE